MGSIKGDEVIVGAEVEALKGIVVAMRSALMVGVAIVGGMTIGVIIMKAGAKGMEVQALGIGEDVAEALVEGGTAAQYVKAARRGVLKLSNGTVRGNRKKMQTISMKMQPTITRIVTMDMLRMMISTIISRSSLHLLEPINPD